MTKRLSALQFKHPSTGLTIVVVALFSLFAASLLSGCTPTGAATPGGGGGGGSGGGGGTTTTKAGPIQVFFTTPKYPDKAENHQGSVDEHLTAFVNTAQKSIDMAIYQLDLPNVTQALLDAAKRGVKVRVATDIDILEDPKENPSFLQLQQAGIPVKGGNSDAIMHDKFVVVDQQAVWMGTWNFTTNDTYRYNNVGLEIQSPELARNYTAAFEKMFVDGQFGVKKSQRPTTPQLTIGGLPVENYFTPQDDATSAIIKRVAQARKSIHFMAFSFTDDPLGQAVLDRAAAGVEVRGVFENTGSETQYSEYGRMKKAGLDVLQDGNPYLMHHKVFIIDGQTVVVGSFNFSKNAATQNDENLIIVDGPALAKLFEAEFQRVYATAQNPPNKK